MPKRIQRVIRIIRPSSREKPDLLSEKIKELREKKWNVLYDELPEDMDNKYVAAPLSARLKALSDALMEKESTCVLCARGGYGASDLLSALPWSRLRKIEPKLVVGFSDISAIHSALYAKLGWSGIHGPMPATTLWRKDGESKDIDILLKLLDLLASKAPLKGSLSLDGLVIKSDGDAGSSSKSLSVGDSIEGWLFGGCFSVLSNLIGTPFFPKSLKGAILFLEDTGDNPGRLLRYWNQWLQSGVLNGVRGAILGNFLKLGDRIPDNDLFFLKEFARRSPFPVFETTLFGHVSPNYPLMIGAKATVTAKLVRWAEKSSQK